MASVPLYSTMLKRTSQLSRNELEPCSLLHLFFIIIKEQPPKRVRFKEIVLTRIIQIASSLNEGLNFLNGHRHSDLAFCFFIIWHDAIVLRHQSVVSMNRILPCRIPPSFDNDLQPSSNQMKNTDCAERKILLNNPLG